MKLRLEIDESKYPDLRRELQQMGIEFTEDAPFALALPDNTFYLYDAEGQLFDEHQLDAYENTQKQ